MENALDKIISRGILVSPECSKLINAENIEPFLCYLDKCSEKPFLLDKNFFNNFLEAVKMLPAQPITEPTPQFLPEVKRVTDTEFENLPIDVERHVFHRPKIETRVKLKKNYVTSNKHIDITDWVSYYLDRYNKLSDILQNREELKSAMSINRVVKINGRQAVVTIGMVRSIRKTFSGFTILELEDPTGTVRVSLKAHEVARLVDEIVPDEVIGVVGTKSGDYIYAEKIIFPEIPERPIKKAEEEVYAAFISDTHVGSNMFLPKELTQFTEWLKGRIGNEKQQELASKIKYLFVVGDLVDGVGVYPGQEKELFIQDIYKQYDEWAKYFADLPDDIHLIIVPGNHDAVRMAEPQNMLFEDISGAVHKLPNVVLASNPATINIQSSKKFPGFDVLLYHGYSLDHYASDVASLRKGGYDRADQLMEFLLRKRHLAPTHGSTLVNPMAEDFLVIDKVPDIFATAHIHKAKVGKYKQITNVCCSCFQDKTLFQEKVGHTPEPAKVPIINLQTNEVKLMKFRE